MPAEYDLVILGGALEGRQAALSAANYGARVALVEPPQLFFRRQQAKYLLRGLAQLANGQAQQTVRQWFQSTVGASVWSRPDVASLDWAGLVAWSAIAAETQQPDYALPVLSAKGVDVICAMPERLSRDRGVVAGGRALKARSVLAAFGTVPVAPLGNRSTRQANRVWITGIESLLERKTLPEQIFVWGQGLTAIAWAEALSLLGVRVTLVTPLLLPEEDADMRKWAQAHLTSMGVQWVTPLSLIGVGLSASEAQTLVDKSLFLGASQPALALPAFVGGQTIRRSEAVSGWPDSTGLQVNEYWQTTHPRLFACGSLVHASDVSAISLGQGVQAAVWNALFIKTRKINASAIIFSHSRFARAGVTPLFAKDGQTPPSDYTVWYASSPNSADLGRVSPMASYCKLICQRDRLQSVHLLGDGASELITLLAVMLGKPVSQLARSVSERLPPASGEQLIELVLSAANQSAARRWQLGNWRRDWAENWCNWRRTAK